MLHGAQLGRWIAVPSPEDSELAIIVGTPELRVEYEINLGDLSPTSA
jgi:hypothetical protein